jgi:hypothetical protein
MVTSRRHLVALKIPQEAEPIIDVDSVIVVTAASCLLVGFPKMVQRVKPRVNRLTMRHALVRRASGTVHPVVLTDGNIDSADSLSCLCLRCSLKFSYLIYGKSVKLP